MNHVWTMASWYPDTILASNTNEAISPLMKPGSDDDKSGALGYGVALATSVFVALAF